jgi:steroid delta-isomerase-like uncharacterized protein
MRPDLSSVLAANLALVSRHLSAENAHQIAQTLDTLHPECVFEDTSLGLVYRGREGAAEYYKTWWDAFAIDVRSGARHWTTEGNMVAEATYVGVHIGDFYGLPATGRSIEIRLAVVITFKDGLMVGERFYYDTGALFSQLGISAATTAALPALVG